MRLTPALRAEYNLLFASCEIRPRYQAAVERRVIALAAGLARYLGVARELGLPWYVVAVIHSLEADLDFSRHLHNGDPLGARTRRVPRGRPADGEPPFSWEESASDALRLRGLHEVEEWDLPTLLFQLEAYNGWGYRRHHPEVLSPYLWSFSNHYERGKYVGDGSFSSAAVSRQPGGAVLLSALERRGLARIPGRGADSPAGGSDGPPLRYSGSARLPRGADLQAFLNGFPGIDLRVDGRAGPRTSEAFRAVTGRYLVGDPREPSPGPEEERKPA